MTGWIVFGTVTLLAAAPIAAVCIGARAFDFPEEPKPTTCTDDTISIPRIHAPRNPNHR